MYKRTATGDECKHRVVSISLEKGSHDHIRNGCSRVDNSNAKFLTLGRCRHSYCPLEDKELHFDKLMRLEGWVKVGEILWGNVYNDPRDRKDGSMISTSKLMSPVNGLKEGQVISTRNSKYLLGKPNGEA